MKINVKSFTAGLLTATLIGSLGFTALAATGTISLEVTPVKIMVNNQEFKPKDAQGGEVLVFNHDGTVYAPLRGLADAYGLNVGWDQEKQMATVWDGVAPTAPTKTEAETPNYSNWSKEDEQKYQQFKNMWDFKYDKVERSPSKYVGDREIYEGYPKTGCKAVSYFESLPQDTRDLLISRVMYELKGSPGIILILKDGNNEKLTGVSAFTIWEDGSIWLGHK